MFISCSSCTKMIYRPTYQWSEDRRRLDLEVKFLKSKTRTVLILRCKWIMGLEIKILTKNLYLPHVAQIKEHKKGDFKNESQYTHLWNKSRSMNRFNTSMITVWYLLSNPKNTLHLTEQLSNSLFCNPLPHLQKQNIVKLNVTV
jgi:hypothetical protein